MLCGGDRWWASSGGRTRGAMPVAAPPLRWRSDGWCVSDRPWGGGGHAPAARWCGSTKQRTVAARAHTHARRHLKRTPSGNAAPRTAHPHTMDGAVCGAGPLEHALRQPAACGRHRCDGVFACLAAHARCRARRYARRHHARTHTSPLAHEARGEVAVRPQVRTINHVCGDA